MPTTQSHPTQPIAKKTAILPIKAVLPPEQDQVLKVLKKAMTLEAATSTLNTATSSTMQRVKKPNQSKLSLQPHSSISTKQKCARTLS